MNEIMLVVLKTLPLILTLLLGVWAKKTGFFSIDAIQGFKKISLNIGLPCILFLTFFKAELEPELLILSGVIFVVCVFGFAMGFLIKKLQGSSNQFYPSLFTTFLTGPIGFPLFTAYFGAESLYKLAILDIGNTLFIFTVLTVFLSTVSCNVNRTERKSISSHLQNLVKSPLTISMFLGLVMSITGLSPMIANVPIAIAVLETIGFIGSMTFPLILIVIGYELPFDFRNYGKISTAVLLRMTMMLSIAYLVNTFIVVGWLGLDEIYQAAVYTMFILPPPFIIPLYIIGECEHKRYVLDFISLHLLASLLAFVILNYLI